MLSIDCIAKFSTLIIGTSYSRVAVIENSIISSASKLSPGFFLFTRRNSYKDPRPAKNICNCFKWYTCKNCVLKPHAKSKGKYVFFFVDFDVQQGFQPFVCVQLTAVVFAIKNPSNQPRAEHSIQSIASPYSFYFNFSDFAAAFIQAISFFTFVVCTLLLKTPDEAGVLNFPPQ